MANTIEIIKYEGDNTTFVWKHPIEDFNTGSQLIVHETQEAIFYLNGQALDLFGPGRHTLETQNIPLLKKYLNVPSDGSSPFHCEIYYINKIEQMAIKWGTDSQVQYMDPTYKFPLKIGASGEMALRIDDSRKLLNKLVGTEKALGQLQLVSVFRAFLMARIKPYIARVMQTSNFSIFEIDSYMKDISDSLHLQLIPDFQEYGIRLERFFITNIVKPDGDKAYERFKDIHVRQYSDIAEAKLRQKVGIIDQETSAQRLVIESAAVAKKRELEGYSYAVERGFDVAEKVADNEGIGNFSNTGIGLGMIGGVAGGMGSFVAGITSDVLNQSSNNEANVKIGSIIPIAGFEQQPPILELEKNENNNPMDKKTNLSELEIFNLRMEKLNSAKEKGFITEEEFQIRKKELISSI